MNKTLVEANRATEIAGQGNRGDLLERLCALRRKAMGSQTLQWDEAPAALQETERRALREVLRAYDKADEREQRMALSGLRS